LGIFWGCENEKRAALANRFAKAALSDLNISGGVQGLEVSGCGVGWLSDVDGAGCGERSIC
jgi:hypothetical protein